jgi:hypothetical protein
MNLSKILILGATLFLSACVNGFSKQGASYQNYLDDRYACLKEAAGPFCANKGVMVTCMMQKGWRESSDGFKPPQGAAVRMCD